MQIIVDMDRVIIEDQELKRPERIPRGQWIQYWEIVKWRYCKCPNCGASYGVD